MHLALNNLILRIMQFNDEIIRKIVNFIIEK
jgi:hypothetical protein